MADTRGTGEDDGGTEVAEYQPADFERISRAAAHVMKMADGLVRLVEIASGRADSRPDKGAEWLRALSDQQLVMVMGWIDAVEAGAAGGRPHGGSR